MNSGPLLKIMPERRVQNPHVLANADEIASRLVDLLWNEKHFASRQGQLQEGRWGYYPQSVTSVGLSVIVGRHLRGEETWGFYAHSNTGTSRWLCVDVDLRNCLLDAVTEKSLLESLATVLLALDTIGVPPEARLVELSGGKGLHVWILITEIPTNEARRFWGLFKSALNPLPSCIGLDLFPHPQSNPEQVALGHLVKLPLGLQAKSGLFSCLLTTKGREIETPLTILEQLVPWQLPGDLPELEDGQAVFKARKRTRPRKPSNAIPALPMPEIPHFSHRYRQMIEGCAFLREFHERPKAVSHQHWTRAGMILTHLGPDGEAWFHYLSGLDSRRFNGSHQNVIDAVKLRGNKPPTCKTTGCAKCDKISPFQCVDSSKRHFCFLPGEMSESENISFEEVQGNLRTELEKILHGTHEENKGHRDHSPIRSGEDDDSCGDRPEQESEGSDSDPNA